MPTAVVTSRANPRVKQLRAAFADQRRLAEGLVAVEGEHLLKEAVRSRLRFTTIFLREDQRAPKWLPNNVSTVELSRDVFASAVETQSPQGVAALVEPPQWTLGDTLRHGTPLLLIAAGIQDPGNLGTLLRSAEAFGATGVLTTAGTVSEWNQKVLRASAGSVFRIPVVRGSDSDLAHLSSTGVRILAAAAERPNSPSAQSLTPATADLSKACALMIGNEGGGVAPEHLRVADALISIPMPGPVESLNAAVAGSILLYEAARQRSANAKKPRNDAPR